MAGTDDLQRLVDAVEPVAGERLQVPGPVARRARSVVASYARDEEDCLLLLQVLGLTQEGEYVGEEPRVEGRADGEGRQVPAPPRPDGDEGAGGRRRLRP